MAATRQRRGFELPDYFSVRGERWLVVQHETRATFENAALEQRGLGDPGREKKRGVLMGFCSFKDRAVHIAPHRTRIGASRTFTHEALHAIIPAGHVTAAEEELLVRAIEYPLTEMVLGVLAANSDGANRVESISSALPNGEPRKLSGPS